MDELKEESHDVKAYISKKNNKGQEALKVSEKLQDMHKLFWTAVISVSSLMWVNFIQMTYIFKFSTTFF